MDSQPGPSRIKDDTEQPNKKLKTDDLQEETEFNSSTTFDDLPDEMILEIFKYVSVPDRLIMQSVCKKWYQISKSKILWKHLVLTNVGGTMISKILCCLPPCVSYFEWKSSVDYLVLPLSLVKFMAKLHERCPSLKTLILQKVIFLSIDLDRCGVIFNKIKRALGEDFHQSIEIHYKKDETIGLENLVLPELKIFSMVKVIFSLPLSFDVFTSSVFPKLTVLDLSYSHFKKGPYLYGKGDILFGSLPDLEQFYFARTNLLKYKILDSLKNFKKLRVLDLGFTRLSGDILSVLQENCTYLQELYLCHREFEDVPQTSEAKECFPYLHTLCLRKTNVTQKYMENLLTKCPSLKLVNVKDCENITEMWCQSLSEVFKEKLRYCECDHFLKRMYYPGQLISDCIFLCG